MGFFLTQTWGQKTPREEWTDFFCPLEKRGGWVGKTCQIGKAIFVFLFQSTGGSISRFFCFTSSKHASFPNSKANILHTNLSISGGVDGWHFENFRSPKIHVFFFQLKFLKMPSFLWGVTFAANSPPTHLQYLHISWCRHRMTSFVARGAFERRRPRIRRGRFVCKKPWAKSQKSQTFIREKKRSKNLFFIGHRESRLSCKILWNEK